MDKAAPNFESAVKGDVLYIDLRRGFDFGPLQAVWAQKLIELYPGPFQEIQFDMSRCVDVSSTLFAGMLQLQAHYKDRGTTSFAVLNPVPRVVKNIRMMRIDNLFEFRPPQ